MQPSAAAALERRTCGAILLLSLGSTYYAHSNFAMRNFFLFFPCLT